MTRLRRHLEDPWRDTLVTRMRLLGVRGAAIGDALAEVDAHCAESGEVPEDAFGPADTYAESLAATYRADGEQFDAPTRWWQAALLGGATTLGVHALLDGLDHLVHGGAGAIGAGGLAAALVIAVVAAVWVPGIARLLLRSVSGMAVAWLALTLTMVAVVALGQWATPVIRLPAAAEFLLGLGLLGSVWLPWLGGRWMRNGPLRDPVVDPRTGRERRALPRWTTLALLWTFPIVLLACGVIVALIPPQ